MMNRTASELASAQHGQHIYAFCNVRTNQVLYSLDRSLSLSHLKQLPDLGANYTPPSIRKDSWRPLWSVSLPPTPTGRSQGLHAFKKLREWRKLHETCWEPSSQISRVYTEKEIKVMQEKLDDRGGSKKETVYDVIKREKHKMKVRAVMDQKANSIADLAAVLVEQENLGEKTARIRSEKEKKTLEDARKEMLQLAAEAVSGGPERVAEQIHAVSEKLRQDAEGQKKKLRRELRDLELKRKKMLFARDAVALAKEAVRGGGEAAAYWGKLADVSESQRGIQLRSNEERIKELKPQLRKMRNAVEHRPDVQEPMSDEMKTQTSQAQDAKVEQLQQELAGLEEYNEHLVFATEQREQGLDSVQTSFAAHSAGLKAQVSKAASDIGVERAEAELAQESRSEQDLEVNADFAGYLPAWPAWADPLQQSRNRPKRGWLKQELKRRNSPIFTAQGITVRWADVLDAEFAELWPEDVQHERMEMSKRTQYTHPAVEPPTEEYDTLSPTVAPDALNDADAAEAIAEAAQHDKESKASAKNNVILVTPQDMLLEMRNDILKTIRKKAEAEKIWTYKLDRNVYFAKSWKKARRAAEAEAAEVLPEDTQSEGAEERSKAT